MGSTQEKPAVGMSLREINCTFVVQAIDYYQL